MLTTDETLGVLDATMYLARLAATPHERHDGSDDQEAVQRPMDGERRWPGSVPRPSSAPHRARLGDHRRRGHDRPMASRRGAFACSECLF